MNKNIKEISFKDFKESPQFVLILFVLVILIVVGLISYSVYTIVDTKKELVEVRNSYKAHIQEIATLEELRAQSQKAEEQLTVYKEVLPDNLDDVYVLSEDVEKICNNFGLTVTTFQEPTEIDADTKETMLQMTVDGSFSNIVLFMQYVTTLRQIHRIDSISLVSTTPGVYSAELTITILSQDGASGVIAPME